MSKQFGTVKTGAVTLGTRLKGHFTTFLLLGVTIAFFIFAYDRIYEWALIPFVGWMEQFPLASNVIGWFRTNYGTEDWTKISAIGTMFLIGWVGHWVFSWSRWRAPKEEVKVAEEPVTGAKGETSPPAKVDEAVAKATEAAASEAVGTTGKTIAELEAANKALEEQLAAK